MSWYKIFYLLSVADSVSTVSGVLSVIFGLLGGIGFTMSLFITTLAFEDDTFINPAKIGILVGSLVSGIAGFFVLKATLPKDNHQK